MDGSGDELRPWMRGRHGAGTRVHKDERQGMAAVLVDERQGRAWRGWGTRVDKAKACLLARLEAGRPLPDLLVVIIVPS